jgi:MoaA/NifB/PqqE/SkfB family radical SAM enzyme
MYGMLSIAITHRCNLHCEYCYADAGSTGRELPLSSLLALHDNFMSAFAEHTEAIDITVTGGEPLLRPTETLALLQAAAGHPGRIPEDRIALNTNGALLNAAFANQLRDIDGLHVWISIDGDKSTHDCLRGPGSYALACGAIECLRTAGIWCGAAFFPTESNLSVMNKAAHLSLTAGANQFVVQFPMSVGRWRGRSILPYLSELYGRLRLLHNEFGALVQTPLQSMQEYAKTCGPCPIGRNITFHVTPSGQIYPCYSLVGSPFSIGTIQNWPRTPAAYFEALATFHRHEALCRVDNIGCLAGCPGTLPPGSSLPESWIGLHNSLLSLR